MRSMKAWLCLVFVLSLPLSLWSQESIGGFTFSFKAGVSSERGMTLHYGMYLSIVFSGVRQSFDDGFVSTPIFMPEVGILWKQRRNQEKPDIALGIDLGAVFPVQNGLFFYLGYPALSLGADFPFGPDFFSGSTATLKLSPFPTFAFYGIGYRFGAEGSLKERLVFDLIIETNPVKCFLRWPWAALLITPGP